MKAQGSCQHPRSPPWRLSRTPSLLHLRCDPEPLGVCCRRWFATEAKCEGISCRTGRALQGAHAGAAVPAPSLAAEPGIAIATATPGALL